MLDGQLFLCYCIIKLRQFGASGNPAGISLDKLPHPMYIDRVHTNLKSLKKLFWKVSDFFHESSDYD
jgi:hypothetical protein